MNNNNNNEPMTAEQRVRELYGYADGSLGDCDSAACAELIVRLMEEHAKAEVEAAEYHITELVRERNLGRLEVMRLQQHRSELDCTYAGAYGESDGASHCPADKPCQRCTLERKRDEARVETRRRTDERDVAYTALACAARALAANELDLARDILCRTSARDLAAQMRRADQSERDAALARVAELEREQDEARERLSDQIARSWNAGFRRAQNAKNALSRRDWVAFMLDTAKPGTTLEVPQGIDDAKGGE